MKEVKILERKKAKQLHIINMTSLDSIFQVHQKTFAIFQCYVLTFYSWRKFSTLSLYIYYIYYILYIDLEKRSSHSPDYFGLKD